MRFRKALPLFLRALLLSLTLLLPKAQAATEYRFEPFVVGPDPTFLYSLIEGQDDRLYCLAYPRGSVVREAPSLVSFKKDGTDFAVLKRLPLNFAGTTQLIDGKDGFFYGFSGHGGANDLGVIFRLKLDASPAEVLYTFSNLPHPDTDGSVPNCLVVDAANNTLYGCAADAAGGLVFKLGTDGTGYTVLKSFPSNDPGPGLPGNLIKTSDGLLYGVQRRRLQEDFYYFEIFKLTVAGAAYATIASPVPRFGAIRSIFEAQDGQLYAVVSSDGKGSIVAVNKDGSGLHTLFGPSVSPLLDWMQGADGALYGSVVAGEPQPWTLWRTDPATGHEDVLAKIPYAFGPLVRGSEGYLYGTFPTSLSGNTNFFRMRPMPAGAPHIFALGYEVALDQVQYYGTTKFALTSSIPDAKIFYTTDGSAPTSNSVPYLLPFEVSAHTVLRAIAYSADLTQSGERAPVTIDIVPTRTLAIRVTGKVNGTVPGTFSVDPSPVLSGAAAGEYRYLAGAAVTVTLTPDPFYRFLRWEGGGGGTNLTKVITLDSDVLLTAVFELRRTFTMHTYTKTLGQQGVVAGNGSEVSGGNVNAVHPEGSIVEIVALPKPGWEFIRWSGEASGTNPTNHVLMDEGKTIEAVFGTDVVTPVTGAGTVELVPPNGPYAVGSQVLIVGHPAPGYFLAHWGEKANNDFNPLSFGIGGIEGPRVVSATFAPIPQGQVLLTVNVDGPGFVSGDPARTTFTPGQITTLTATPVAGEIFRGWTYRVGEQDFSSLNPVLSFAVNAEATATAHFGTVQVPSISQPPQPVTVVQGYTATFRVQATGGQPLSYQWRREGVDLAENLRFVGTTNATLTIKAVNAVNAGNYSVRVSNSAGGVTSTPVSLTVLDGLADTDGDGLRNADEAALGTNPTLADTDGDGLSDFREFAELHTDPRKADTDGDGFSDAAEVAAGSDPLQNTSSPDGQLNAYFAVELEFFTIVGHRYQLQKSADLQTWVNVDAAFTSTESLSHRFVSARNADSGYWRLVAAP